MNHQRIEQANKIARKTFHHYHFYYPETMPEDEKKRYLMGIDALFGFYRKTKVPCSRQCCGNPRRHFGEITLQEKRADIAEKEFLEDVGT